MSSARQLGRKMRSAKSSASSDGDKNGDSGDTIALVAQRQQDRLLVVMSEPPSMPLDLPSVREYVPHTWINPSICPFLRWGQAAARGFIGFNG